MKDGERLQREEIYNGRIVRLSLDRVRLPNGEECSIELIRHQGAAAVVPIDDEDHVLLVRQYRYAAGGWLLEVPAGKLDPGEPPEQCALREIEEETGYRAAELRPLGWVFTTPGFTDEKIWLFAARGLTRTRQRLERDEVLKVERVSLSRAVEMASGGEIRDAKSVCVLLRAARTCSDHVP